MTTTTNTPRTIDQQEQKKIFNTAMKAFEDSYGEAFVTAAVTVLTMVYMFNVVHPVFLSFAPGFYLIAMILQLLIRFVRRFDTHYTVDELAERVIEMESSIKSDLDEIKRNV
jgi:hypothetical protein